MDQEQREDSQRSWTESWGSLRGYVEWLPYRATIERAEVFLTGGRPFSYLDDGQRSRLKAIHTTRNAIAHGSKFARDKFDDEVIGDTPLLSRERTPTGFLRSRPNRAFQNTRFTLMLADMRGIATTLTT